MKRMLDKSRKTMRNYWGKLMRSSRTHMPRGAQFIDKMIAWARGENWRGNRKNKK